MGSALDAKLSSLKRKATCLVCGRDFFTKESIHRRQFCDSCYTNHVSNHEKVVKEYVELKVKVQHEMAMQRLERCYDGFRMADIWDSVKAVEEMESMSPESFRSSYEIIAAIVLMQESYFFKINHKVENYTVDFYLPEEKICLEIDGALHGMRLAADGKRDVEIRHILGAEWETVRMPTRYLDKHPMKLPEAMEAIAENQRRIRRKNGGMLPHGYSKTTKAYYDSLLK